MIDIRNIADLVRRLEKLAPGQRPQWGTLGPQQMVEHLASTVSFSNGKKSLSCTLPLERALELKQRLIGSDMPFPKGIKAPFEVGGALGGDLSLESSVQRLEQELEAFFLYFDHDPGALPEHPVLGPMDREEWILFHNKHFAHHFE